MNPLTTARDIRWKLLFLFSLGLALGAAFCMKWMEPGFVTPQGRFGIIGLELTYSPEQIRSIFQALTVEVRASLEYHLYFDFVFMAGVYPCVAALLMLVARRYSFSGWRMFFLVLAFLQSLAWACDIAENLYLLHWLGEMNVPEEMGVYHVIVIAKWLLVLTGLTAALTGLVSRWIRPAKTLFIF